LAFLVGKFGMSVKMPAPDGQFSGERCVHG
jgi:hypothetical protein